MPHPLPKSVSDVIYRTKLPAFAKVDQRLRDNGFRIWFRKAGEPALWLKDGWLYTVEEATLLCRK